MKSGITYNVSMKGWMNKMTSKKIKIGFAPTKRDCFLHPEAQEYRQKILSCIESPDIEIIDICGINDDDMIQYDSDVDKVIELFKKADIDGVFFPHCNFGSESMVAKIAAAMKKPVLLWGPRDNTPPESEFRHRDTQCGLFATGKALRRMNIPFTYLVNSWVDDSSFLNGFRSFTAVCAVVRDFTNMRILQIGVRPQPFWSVAYNEPELMERFGIEVYPVPLPQVEQRVKELIQSDNDSLSEIIRDFGQRLNCQGITDAQLRNMAALLLAIRELCQTHGCNSVAIHCWETLWRTMGCATCTINGFLTEQGIPVACEADIHGAVSSILLQAAAMRTSSVFFADLTNRHPDNDNAELLWHCGNFPPSLAIDSRQKLLSKQENTYPAQSNWEIRHGDITVCRFDGDHGEYRLLMGEGRGVDGPPTVGTYCWFEVDCWDRWEKHLVEGPYIHHCTGVHGKYAHILFEACKYLGIETDPVSPSAQELESRWLGH